MNFYKPEMSTYFVKHKDRYGYFIYNQISLKYFHNWLAAILENPSSFYVNKTLNKIVSQKYPGISRDDMFVKVAMDKKSNNWKYK